MPTNFLPAILRTVVPMAVGWLLSLALLGHIFDLFGVPAGDRSADVGRLVTVVISALYYVLVRFLEAHKAWFGVLLGWMAQPTYQTVVAQPGDYEWTGQDGDGIYPGGAK